MIFKNLKEKCLYYRDLTDYKLMPNGYILVMIDGKNFSSLIKNKFKKPFDDDFIGMMNDTAMYLCKNIQNCIGAYVQSDEISLILDDNPMVCTPFSGRLCKIQSIIPALATSVFTKKMVERVIKSCGGDIISMIEKMPEYVFDCKAWVVPDMDNALGWFIYRHNDCVKNSKQQFCQTYMSHKELMGKNTDEQVSLCKSQTGNDWNELDDDRKYGRFFYKNFVTKVSPEGVEYTRGVWEIDSMNFNSTLDKSLAKKRLFSNDD